MNCVILQPSYIPWRGYFRQILLADYFVFYDDALYDPRGGLNRNRIKTPDGPKWLSVPVLQTGSQSRETPINEVRIRCATSWQEKHWQVLEQSYGHAPYFQRYAPLLRRFYESREERLSDLTISMTIALARAVGILGTWFIRSSRFSNRRAEGDRTDRLLSILQKLPEVTRYIACPSAREFLHERKFREAGIEVEYITSDYAEYPQLYPPFDGKVSILDLLFMMGPETLNYIRKGSSVRSTSTPRIPAAALPFGAGHARHCDEHPSRLPLATKESRR